VRKPIIAGNWKMHLTTQEAVFLAEYLKRSLAEETEAETVVCPPFTSLFSVREVLQGTKLKLGAQNMFWELKGAYTGEISPAMLLDLGCQYVILGHSERREHFLETDQMVNKKAKTALANGINPIVCVGESLSQREAGQTEEVIREQVTHSLAEIGSGFVEKIVVAYEPIWAIGTGKTATAEIAAGVIKHIRSILSQMYGEEKAQAVRIQYGGSVKPENIAELMAKDEIDGVLVGGASLEPASFSKIVGYNKG